jgi:Ca2+-binding RTX toxin-like protein
MTSEDASEGAQTYYGSTGDDTLMGGKNNDTLYGGAGNDTIYGYDPVSINPAEDADLIYGGSGNDTLYGNQRNDQIYGGSGNDTLIGNGGDDTLTGGLGNDNFRFLSTADGVDTIMDFDIANDTLQFDNASFTAIGPDGTLAASAFHIGSAAADSDDRIIYDPTGGELYYDADGSGSGVAIQIGELSVGLSLTNDQFHII